ncbi:hypothetical protein [Nostoc sp. TCL26-01]|uniref:hypothetical protein n=1 Tax=Nostoc sp. TCL26-01 TaxID=2576904 RepID=UPI0015BEDBF1|nr:hypothetical protein [Nostoc sp. TCL26-01]QLE58226.1 hypothetical protein FD725_23540 [Nostoc sp. TCL26-01]
MAIAQQNTASLTITIDNSPILNQKWLWQPVHTITALIKKFWWHTHAYGTILGIMLLALVSVIFLSLYWSYQKLLPIFNWRVSGSHD